MRNSSTRPPGRNTLADWSCTITMLHYADETVDVITIFDHDLGNMSVTNDIENVLAEIAKDLPKPLSEYPITYFDSTDSEDEIIVGENNGFLSFAALPRGRTSRFVKHEAARRWAGRRRAAS